uniref:Coiled-coil domain containing 117 n=1 Tax=Macrostomum lignano TaxID=282301 RepID=A0A1I8F200_9PLAT
RAESQRPSEAGPKRVGLLSWLVREELSCQIQLKAASQGRSRPRRPAVEDTERNFKRGDAANAGETAGGQSAGGEEVPGREATAGVPRTGLSQIRHSELELLRLRRCLDSARQEFAELPWRLPISQLPAQLPDRRLEQADRWIQYNSGKDETDPNGVGRGQRHSHPQLSEEARPEDGGTDGSETKIVSQKVPGKQESPRRPKMKTV